MAQPRPRAHASDTRRETRSANNNGAEHRDGWRPNSLVAEQVHPQHGRGAMLRVIPNMVAEQGCREPKHPYIPKSSRLLNTGSKEASS